MKHKVGDVVLVRESKFLGMPATKMTITHVYDYYYRGVCHDNPLDEAEVDEEGYCLIGPPLDGKLVRAP